MESRDYSQVTGEEPNDDASETLFQKRRCCFCFSWSSSTRSSTAGLNWWQRVRSGEVTCDNSLWARGTSTFNKLRELSEIVAGPRWKTFIRRFNRSGRRKNPNYRYDPLSYALNFDDGPGQNGNLDEEEDSCRLSNFSMRYAGVPASAKASMDWGKDGPNFV